MIHDDELEHNLTLTQCPSYGVFTRPGKRMKNILKVEPKVWVN